MNSRNDVWNTLNLIGGYLDEDLDEETADQLWDLAQRFESILPERTLAEKAIKKSLKIRKPSPALATAVKRYLMEEGVVVQSGRIRNYTKFTESRNGVFQGNGADSVILAAYDLVRAGFDLQMIIHDEVVISIPDDLDRDNKLKRLRGSCAHR